MAKWKLRCVRMSGSRRCATWAVSHVPARRLGAMAIVLFVFRCGRWFVITALSDQKLATRSAHSLVATGRNSGLFLWCQHNRRPASRVQPPRGNDRRNSSNLSLDRAGGLGFLSTVSVANPH